MDSFVYTSLLLLWVLILCWMIKSAYLSGGPSRLSCTNKKCFKIFGSIVPSLRREGNWLVLKRSTNLLIGSSSLDETTKRPACQFYEGLWLNQNIYRLISWHKKLTCYWMVKSFMVRKRDTPYKLFITKLKPGWKKFRLRSYKGKKK